MHTPPVNEVADLRHKLRAAERRSDYWRDAYQTLHAEAELLRAEVATLRAAVASARVA